MKCPFCDRSEAKLISERRTRTFRKEEFELFEFFYKCEKCGEEFTTTDIDTLNTNQVYNQYREKYSIPFPDQLTAIREQYHLSAAKMSEILGFGPNQYRMYENGELPAGGNATVLSLIVNPASFKDIILKNKTILSDNKIDELLNKIDIRINANLKNWFEKSLFPTDIIPDRFRGFSVPHLEKFANMVIFFIENAPFKVRLNKLLFYADFLNYKISGFSISGCQYAAIDMGSVPDRYASIYELLESKEFIGTKSVLINSDEVEKFIAQKNFDVSLFSKSELDTMERVLSYFKSVPTWKLKKISHNELGWIDNEKSKAIIDYSVYAPQLKAI